MISRYDLIKGSLYLHLEGLQSRKLLLKVFERQSNSFNLTLQNFSTFSFPLSFPVV